MLSRCRGVGAAIGVRVWRQRNTHKTGSGVSVGWHRVLKKVYNNYTPTAVVSVEGEDPQ